MRNVVLVWVTG